MLILLIFSHCDMLHSSNPKNISNCLHTGTCSPIGKRFCDENVSKLVSRKGYFLNECFLDLNRTQITDELMFVF